MRKHANTVAEVQRPRLGDAKRFVVSDSKRASDAIMAAQVVVMDARRDAKARAMAAIADLRALDAAASRLREVQAEINDLGRAA